MTDKEIIIDGVNVAGCEQYKQAFTGFICADPNKSNNCSKNPNCYSKQLQRKSQECERLKYDNDYQVGALETTIDNLKQEYEELKKEKELYVTWYRAKHDDWADAFFKTIKSRDRYKQVLEKIEEECEHYKNAPFHLEAIYAKSSMDETIEILNEVKDAD